MNEYLSTQPLAASLAGHLCGIIDGAWRRFEAALFEPSVKRVEVVTASTRDLLASESGLILCNSGATATVTLNLPPATPGLRFTLHARAAYNFRANPQDGEVIANNVVNSADGGAGKYIGCNNSNIGGSITLQCITASRWEVVASRGTWSLET